MTVYNQVEFYVQDKPARLDGHCRISSQYTPLHLSYLKTKIDPVSETLGSLRTLDDGQNPESQLFRV
jgi:hypothetical protein